MSMIGQLKVLLRIRKPAQGLFNEVRNVKSGWKTTEFWMVVVSNLIGIAGALNGVLDAETAAKVLGVLNAVYAILRTLAKTPVSAPSTSETTVNTTVVK